MVMKPEPLAGAIRAARKRQPAARAILLSPQGRPFSQALAAELSALEGLILVCGRYEGVDERVCTKLVDDEISIGDYVLTGGEVAAMIVVDAVTRLLPGALGGADSAADDSFAGDPPGARAVHAPGALRGHGGGPGCCFPATTRPSAAGARSRRCCAPCSDAATSCGSGRWAATRSTFSSDGAPRLKRSSRPRIYLALVHHPVVNKDGEVIASAVTNLDLHDLARTGCTYDVLRFYVVTPPGGPAGAGSQDTGALGRGLRRRPQPGARHGHGAHPHPASVWTTPIAAVRRREGCQPRIVATSARQAQGRIGFDRLRRQMADGLPWLLVFGTAWGLADTVLAAADHVLAPIRGAAGYNHLPVRAAVAIVLDRLVGRDRD